MSKIDPSLIFPKVHLLKGRTTGHTGTVKEYFNDLITKAGQEEITAKTNNKNRMKEAETALSIARWQLSQMNHSLMQIFDNPDKKGADDSFGMTTSGSFGLLSTLMALRSENSLAKAAQLAQALLKTEKQAEHSIDNQAIVNEPTREQEMLSAFIDLPAKPILKTDKKENALESNLVPEKRQNIDTLIEKTAQKYGLDPNLVKAVVKAESDFDPMTVSIAGAEGLMQLMPGTANDLGVTDSFDPAQNLDAGCRYLKQMLDKYSGQLEKALAAYNWGPGNLDRSTGWMPRETRTYIGRVKRFMGQFNNA